MSEKHRVRERAYIALIAKQDAMLRECAEAAEALRHDNNDILDHHLSALYPGDVEPLTFTVKARYLARVLRACRDAGRAD